MIWILALQISWFMVWNLLVWNCRNNPLKCQLPCVWLHTNMCMKIPIWKWNSWCHTFWQDHICIIVCSTCQIFSLVSCCCFLIRRIIVIVDVVVVVVVVVVVIVVVVIIIIIIIMCKYFIIFWDLSIMLRVVLMASASAWFEPRHA